MPEQLPPDSRFQTDPEELVDPPAGLPSDWQVGIPDPQDRFDVARLTHLLREHQENGRGYASAGPDEVLTEISEQGLLTRQNIVLRDAESTIVAWGSVHDRARSRMLYTHLVSEDLTPDGSPTELGDAASALLIEWAEAQAREVGAARGLDAQQIDTGTYAGDERQRRWLEQAGFNQVRTWLQMSRPVAPEEADLVPNTVDWSRPGVRIRQIGSDGNRDADVAAMHAVLEQAFLEHFNSQRETHAEFLNRLGEDPGHDWDLWWIAELEATDGGAPTPVGALVGSLIGGGTGPGGSYVSYLGVLDAARGRGVATGLLRTIIADAARRGHDRVGLEVDADPSGASGLYQALGWETKYVTDSWHKDVPVD